MNPRRDVRGGSRVALFDGIEEGGIRASSSYSREINEQDNDSGLTGLEDRVSILKRLTGDIHEEVEIHYFYSIYGRQWLGKRNGFIKRISVWDYG